MPDTTTDVTEFDFIPPPDNDGNKSTSDQLASGNSKSEGRIEGFEAIDPIAFQPIAEPSGTDAGSEPRRGRGRHPRGCTCDKCNARNASGGYTAKSSATDLAVNLERLLISVHAMGAKVLNVPELELDGTEAKEFSDAIKAYSKFKAIPISPEKLALGSLVAVMISIYGTRVAVIYKKRGDRKEAIKDKVVNIDVGKDKKTPNDETFDMSKASPSMLIPEPPSGSDAFN